MDSRIKVGISAGDFNGIGLEIILKTLSDHRICEMCQPIVYASKKLIQDSLKMLEINDINLKYLESTEELKMAKVPLVIELLNKEDDQPLLEAGKDTSQAGAFALKSLEAASGELKKGNIDVLVTAPINKRNIQSPSFDFPGHTEFLQALDQVDQSLMLMVNEQAIIGVVTSHIPLSKVSEALSSDLILNKITILNKSLKEDFGIRKPRIAVLGLNPHAGDRGLIGSEEEEVIFPAIQQAKTIDILAFGPYPADGFFASANYKNFDGILAMYHDQGLIPAKILSAGMGVNFTAGLSFVRTSPDHGTAYEIAGKGIADAASFSNAIYRAVEITNRRKQNQQLVEEAMEKNKSRN